MEGLSSKTTSAPDGLSPRAAPDQERQTVGPANLSKRVSMSWRQKITPARGRERIVASDSEATGVREPGQRDDPVGAEVAKPESPAHKRRSLVAFMSLRKSKGPRPESAPPDLPPSGNTGTPQPKLATSPLAPAPAPASPSTPNAAAAPASPRPNVGRACTCAVCVRSPSSSGAPRQTAQTAQITTSPPSSPAIHPSFAAFLDTAAMVEAEAARIRPAGNATVTNTPPRPPAQRCPSTTSSRASSRLHPDCSQPACVSATRLIKAIRHLKKEFGKANVAVDYRSALKGLDAPLSAAYQVLVNCEYRSIMARVSRVAAVLKQMEGLPVNNQSVVTQYRTLLRLSGMETSTVPMAVTGTPPRQSVHAGGHTFATGYAPAGGYTPATGGGYMPAASYMPVRGSAPAAGGGYAPPAGYESPIVAGFKNLERTLAARPPPAIGYTPAGGQPAIGHSPAVGHALAAQYATAAGQTPAVANTPIMGRMPTPRFMPAVLPQAVPAAGPTLTAGYSPAAAPRPAMGTPVGNSPAMGYSPAVRPAPAVGYAPAAGPTPVAAHMALGVPAVRYTPATGPVLAAGPVPAAGPPPTVQSMPARVELAPVVGRTPAVGPMMPAAGPAPAAGAAPVPGPASAVGHMSVVGQTSAAGPMSHAYGNAVAMNVV